MTSITSGYPLAPGYASLYVTRNATSQPLDSMAVGPFTALQRALEACEGQEEKVQRPSATAAMTQSLQANSAFLAQQLSQDPGMAESQAVEDTHDGQSAAVTAFLEFMDKTPEEHAFEAFLGSKGMTQEEFEALPESEKQALIEEFKERLKRQVEEETAKRLAQAEISGLF